MKTKQLIALSLSLLCLILASGCASTRTENGVTIENRRGDIPWVPFF